MQFQGAEDYWESTPPVRQSNSYTAETVPGRGVSPNSSGIPLQTPNGGVPYSPPPPQQGNCDPTIMNGNGPPRLRPPPPGAVGPPGRSPSLESSARPPGGPPPRTRMSRTPMSPEEIAQRSKDQTDLAAQQNFVRDCFIIPQESVERFLPDGISVRKIVFCIVNLYRSPAFLTSDYFVESNEIITTKVISHFVPMIRM